MTGNRPKMFVGEFPVTKNRPKFYTPRFRTATYAVFDGFAVMGIGADPALNLAVDFGPILIISDLLMIARMTPLRLTQVGYSNLFVAAIPLSGLFG